MSERFYPFSERAHAHVYFTVNAAGRLMLIDSAGDVVLGGGTSLTGWETDDDGNLVNTGGGALLVGTLGQPITVMGKYVADEPSTLDEGVLFRVSSPNWSGDPEAPQDLVEVDDYDGSLSLIGASLRFKSSTKTFAGRVTVRTITGNGFAEIVAIEDGDECSVLGLASRVLQIGDVAHAWPIHLNGQLVAPFVSGADDPTTSDLPASRCTLWKNLGTGSVRLWANDGGNMKSVALA